MEEQQPKKNKGCLSLFPVLVFFGIAGINLLEDVDLAAGGPLLVLLVPGVVAVVVFAAMFAAVKRARTAAQRTGEEQQPRPPRAGGYTPPPVSPAGRPHAAPYGPAAGGRTVGHKPARQPRTRTTGNEYYIQAGIDPWDWPQEKPPWEL